MLFALGAIMALGVVDSYFVSYLGTTELAAIGFIVPITQIVTGFGLGLGMAISSLTSKLIGAKQTSRAARLIWFLPYGDTFSYYDRYICLAN